MTKSTANATVDESQQLTAANIAVVKAFLLSSKIEPDFGVVAEKINIASKKNAPRDLKKALAKWGLDWKGGVVCELDDAEAGAAAAPTTPAKGTDGAAAKAKASASKRKVDSDESDSKDGAAKKAKKTPKKATKVKSEAKVEDESEESVKEEEEATEEGAASE